MDNEEDFPRRSVATLAPLGEPRRRQHKGLLSDAGLALRTSTKVKHTVKAGASASAASRGLLPTLDNLEVGSLLLGSVAIVTMGGLRVHLPGGLSGFVRASDVIDLPAGERHRAESIVASSFSVGSHVIVSVLEVRNGFISLSMKPSVINKGLRIDSLTPGILLPCSVKAHEDYGTMLSFNLESSSDLRGFLKYEDDVSKGETTPDKKTKVNGTTASSVTAASAKKRKGSNFGKSLRHLPVHSTVYVVVDSVNADRNTVTCKLPSSSDIPVSMDCSLPLLCVRPGLLLTGEITDVHFPASNLSGITALRVNYGFDIKCLSTLGAVVPAVHSVISYSQRRSKSEKHNHLSDTDVNDEVSNKTKRKATWAPAADVATESPPLDLEDNVVGRVIYVDHWQKTIYVSLLSHIVSWKGPKGDPHKLLSNSLKTFAKVVRSIPGHGVIFSLCRFKTEEELTQEHDMDTLAFDSKDLGFCDQSHLSDDGGAGTAVTARAKKSSTTKLALAFTVGSVHSGVELEFDFFTRFTRLTMRKSLSKEKLLSPLQLRGGTSVKGEITKIAKTGVRVRLSKLVHGKVTLEHLTDVPLPQMPDRFIVGGMLKLRVLRFDHVHNVLLLTAKRIMRKDPSPLISFAQISVGKEFVGYVCRMKRGGEESDEVPGEGDVVMVRFYNELQTTLDPSELREAERLSLNLTHGAALRVVVTRLDNRRRAFYVTLSPEKMNVLKSLARAKQKRRREIRREACKKAFTNYVSSRKRKVAEA